MQTQIRRASIAVTANIVEDSTRPSTADYCQFLTVARGSASETGYLLELSGRLGFLDVAAVEPVATEYGNVSAGLLAAIRSLQRR